MNDQSRIARLTLVRGPRPDAVGIEWGVYFDFDLTDEVEAQLAEAGYGPKNPDLWLLAAPADIADANPPRDPLLTIEVEVPPRTLAELRSLIGESTAAR